MNLTLFQKYYFYYNIILLLGKSYSGGNPYHPRETPEWQKPITNFMNQNVTKENDVSSSSKVDIK